MKELSLYLCLILAIVVVVGVLLLMLLSRFYNPKPSALPYVKTPLLTDAERRFFSLLESVLPEHCYLLTQVRLATWYE